MSRAIGASWHVVANARERRGMRALWEQIRGIGTNESTAAAVRHVLQLGDPLLRQQCARVLDPTEPEIQELVRDLGDTLAHWRAQTGYGRGIAAPQIGVLKRVIFLKLPGVEPWPLVNPEIVKASEETIVVWDACLSFLSIFMQVERRRWIRVRYQNLKGETFEFEAGDERNLSELLQHEIDHLDGVLAIDRVVNLKTICTREEFEKRYRAESPYAETARSRIREFPSG